MAKLKGLKRVNRIINEFLDQFGLTAQLESEFSYWRDDFHIGYALAVFKKTNSKDPNVTNIKKNLDRWATNTGIYRKFSRAATRVDYTKAIFLYFIISIQQYC